MLKNILLILMLVIPILSNELNNYKKELENKYFYLNNSGLKSITFHEHFIQLKFNDNKIFCENNSTITDNCNFMLSKEEIFNKSKVLKFLYDIKDKNVILKVDKSNTYLIVDDKYYQKNIENIKKVSKIFNIVVVPLYKNKKNEIVNIYKKYNFKLPTTIIVN